jgi:hypothetical protein
MSGALSQDEMTIGPPLWQAVATLMLQDHDCERTTKNVNAFFWTQHTNNSLTTAGHHLYVHVHIVCIAEWLNNYDTVVFKNL